MRKLLLSVALTIAATSTALAAGGGYDGTVVANVYQFLATHGCPNTGFGLRDCGYYRSAPDYRDKPPRRLNTR
jgi:hypothetical protein